MAEHRYPGNPATAVYGSIIVAGQLAILGGGEKSAWAMLLTLGATMAVFWLAHAYTEVIGTTIATQQPHPLRHALRVDLPIVESAVIPGATLGVLAAAGVSARTAAGVALVVAALDLVGWAVLAARRTGATGGRRVAYTLAAVVCAGLLVALKFAVH